VGALGASVPPFFKLPHVEIEPWGSPNNKGANAPDGSGYTEISSNEYAFAALKADGSIKAWGSSDHGGKGAPTKINAHNLNFR
jgi:hypothetical protein